MGSFSVTIAIWKNLVQHQNWAMMNSRRILKPQKWKIPAWRIVQGANQLFIQMNKLLPMADLIIDHVQDVFSAIINWIKCLFLMLLTRYSNPDQNSPYLKPNLDNFKLHFYQIWHFCLRKIFEIVILALQSCQKLIFWQF